MGDSSQDSVHLWSKGWNWRCLSCRQTFFLILLLLLLPLTLLGVVLWKKTQNEWHILNIASSSLSYHQRLSLLLQEFIEHQQLTQRFLLGDQTLHTALEDLKKRINKEVAYIAQSAKFFDQKGESQEPSFEHLPPPLEQLVNDWKVLSDSHEPLTEERNLSLHLSIMESIRACLKILQERIALSAEGDIVTLLLDQLLYLYIPSIQQDMMQFASLGEQIANTQEPSIEMRHRFIGTMALIQYKEGQLQLNGNRAMHIQHALNMEPALQTILKAPFSELHETVINWLDEVNRTINQGTPIVLGPFIRLSAHAIGESTQLASSIMEQMERLLHQRMSASYRTTRSQVTLFLITLLLILSAACYLFYKILHDIKRVEYVAQLIQKGNTNARFPLDITKELSTLCALFNTIGSSMKDLFDSLHNMEMTFQEASKKVDYLFEKQDQVILEQKTVNRQILIPIKELSRTVEDNLHSIQEAFKGLEKTSSSIKIGKDSIQNISHMMNTLLKVGQELTDEFSLCDALHQNATHLMGTMTQVADRTNLLSLNAAIEAKKTGSPNNGFSLIADEVRRLADQTSHLTLDIGQMIHQIMTVMTSSSEKMQKLFEGLKLTSQQIKPCESTFLTLQTHTEQRLSWLKKLKTRVEEEEQIGETIHQALSPIDHTTQQTAQMMEQLHAEADHINAKLAALHMLLAPYAEQTR